MVISVSDREHLEPDPKEPIPKGIRKFPHFGIFIDVMGDMKPAAYAWHLCLSFFGWLGRRMW